MVISKFLRIAPAALVAVCGLAADQRAANAELMLYGTHTSGSFNEWGLLQFDVPITGKSTRIGAGGLMFDPDFSRTGILYAPQGSTGLAKVDLESGQQTLVGAWGTPNTLMVSIAFAPDGTLYGVDNGGASTSLYSIDVTTGKATKVGAVGDFVFGIDFDPLGNLYGASGSVFSINPTTGKKIKEIVPFDAFITGLDWGADGVLRGVEKFAPGGGSTLQLINLEAGKTHLIGPTTEPDMQGIASIPAPGIAVALLLACSAQRRGTRRESRTARS